MAAVIACNTGGLMPRAKWPAGKFVPPHAANKGHDMYTMDISPHWTWGHPKIRCPGKPMRASYSSGAVFLDDTNRRIVFCVGCTLFSWACSCSLGLSRWLPRWLSRWLPRWLPCRLLCRRPRWLPCWLPCRPPRCLAGCLVGYLVCRLAGCLVGRLNGCNFWLQ